MAPSLSLLIEVAADLRRRAGQLEPSFSTRAIIEECFPDALVTGRALPPGVLEMVSQTSAGPVIVYRRDLPTAVQRFAIAHALAHLIFDGPETACRVGFVGDPEAEARADAFAAELLVPLAELRPYIGRGPSNDADEHELYLDMVDEISSHFHVASSVIDKRIHELILLT